jgi:3' terminal RNA ribose 2'-O-methyltransferase Hen1
MLLTITTTHAPATDLGYLLGKNPARLQTFEISQAHSAHVFYPEATAARCTAALLIDVDPVALVRGPRWAGEFALGQYTNDRPYVASSMLTSALARVFRSALNGQCKERPALAEAAIPLEATLAVVPARGGEVFLRRLFEPLGYAVEATRHPLDPRFPAWGDSRYFTLTLRATTRLADLLTHLYVLVPVLDDDKHYWVGEGEVEKLLERGEGWLASHPLREQITQRYLKRQTSLVRAALNRLADEDDPDPEVTEEVRAGEEEALEAPVRLQDVRLDTVVDALVATGARSVIDLGCGEGGLLRRLLKVKQFERIAGADVSPVTLEHAARRLKLDEMPERKRARIELFQASLTYRDARFAGFDAACAVEVIEHIDPSRLGAFERVVFEFARPETVLITTPNAEYNARFENLPAGRFRHRDHRFEWTRAEFEAWAGAVAARHGYAVTFAPVGPVDEALGAPTQMGVFRR